MAARVWHPTGKWPKVGHYKDSHAYGAQAGLARLLWSRWSWQANRSVAEVLPVSSATNNPFTRKGCEGLTTSLISRFGCARHANQPSPRKGLHPGKVGKIIASSLLTLLVWTVTTWKPIWTAAGADGDRILAAILLLVSTFWVLSLVWICCSKSRRSDVASLCDSSAEASSRNARAS